MEGDRDPVKGAASAVRRVSPSEAKSLLDLGYAYVDVRTVEEFDDVHPAGALNVPLTALPAVSPRSVGISGSEGATNSARASDSNVEFLTTMAELFARDAKIVVGCATGVRSRWAAELLIAAGYADVVEQRAGMDGSRGPFGNLIESGWAEAGLPVTIGPDAGSFAALAARRVEKP